MNWGDGPGTWSASKDNCHALSNGAYDFADTFAGLRGRVLQDIAAGQADAATLERFDYWLTTFRYTRGIALTTCAWQR